MPLYEYVCNGCDHHFEELVSASGTTVVACPQCRQVDVEKLLSKFQRYRGRGGGDSPSVTSTPAPRAGGCCGGGCGCG